MKKMFGLGTVLMIVGIAGVSAQATDSATLSLQGIVPEMTEITVTAESIASDLDLFVSQTDLPVGTLAFFSNDPDGYEVSVESDNNFVLKNAAATKANTVAYALKFAGSGNFTNGLKIAEGDGTPSKETRSLLVSYTGNELLAAGAFNDVLTFTISAN